MIKAAVIGDPIDHSLSPKLHHFFLEKQNVQNAEYSAIQIKAENLDQDLQKLLDDPEFMGCNVTVPHKEAVFDFCVKMNYNITDSAMATRAVNTIYKENGKIFASNSDSFGFLKNMMTAKALPKDFAIKENKTALVLGAGGAAKSAIYTLLNMPDFTKIYMINRNHEKANQLIEFYENPQKEIILIGEINKEIGVEIDLLVNTTPLGMKHQDQLSINIDNLNKKAVIYDIVYNPPMTKLLIEAKKRKNPIITGVGMLIYQALEGFEKWFKSHPELSEKDVEKLKEILIK